VIFVNPTKVAIPLALRNALKAASATLTGKPPVERKKFFEDNRKSTWGHDTLVASLKAVVGNKCWYSEIDLGGADPNVDHFRPKGRVVEVDDNLQKTGHISDGYWWLAFELKNFRLAAQHSNQRRVDEETEGGKADFFPVVGERALPTTPYQQIFETILPLDPCSASDVSLLWFDPDGNPAYSPRTGKPNDFDRRRVKATIWLYHLDKRDTATPRSKAVAEVRRKLEQADNYYSLWRSAIPCMKSKTSFDKEVAEIAAALADTSPFAGAKRCAVRLAMSDYDWIEECQALLI
jgi:hypothetical protein